VWCQRLEGQRKIYEVELRKQMVYLFSYTLYGETTIYKKELKYEYLT
jgi:hypothetical protein